MKRLFQATIVVLVLEALLMVCRVTFYPQYAPKWFWTSLSFLLAVTAALVFYCTILRFPHLRRAQDRNKKITLLGSIVFHCGIALLIFAGFYYTLFQYKALFFLTEGQTLIDSPVNHQVLSRGPVQAGDFEELALTLLEVNVDFYDPRLVEHLAARVQLHDLDSGKSRVIDTAMNRPFTFKSRQATIYKFGFAPLLVLRSSEGELLWHGFVNLDLVGGRPDLFEWPLSGELIKVEASLDENLELTLVLSNQTGAAIVVTPGDPPVEFLGIWLEIPDYRYWLGFVVTSTRGTKLVLVGLFVLTIAIITRYLFVLQKDGAGARAGNP